MATNLENTIMVQKYWYTKTLRSQTYPNITSPPHSPKYNPFKHAIPLIVKVPYEGAKSDVCYKT